MMGLLYFITCEHRIKKYHFTGLRGLCKYLSISCRNIKMHLILICRLLWAMYWVCWFWIPDDVSAHTPRRVIFPELPQQHWALSSVLLSVCMRGPGGNSVKTPPNIGYTWKFVTVFPTVDLLTEFAFTEVSVKYFCCNHWQRVAIGAICLGVDCSLRVRACLCQWARRRN